MGPVFGGGVRDSGSMRKISEMAIRKRIRIAFSLASRIIKLSRRRAKKGRNGLPELSEPAKSLQAGKGLEDPTVLKALQMQAF